MERGNLFCAAQYVSGKFLPWRLSKDKSRRGYLCEGVERVSGHSNGGTNPASRWCHVLLMQGRSLHLGGDMPPWTDGTTAMACRGMLHIPWQNLYHIVRRIGHYQAALRARAIGSRKHVSCLQNTITQFIATKTIMYLFLVAVQRLGDCASKKWW